MTVTRRAPPPQTMEALAEGLFDAGGSGNFATGRITVSQPLELFTLDARDLWEEDPVSSARLSAWRAFVVDGDDVLAADVSGAVFSGIVSGPAVGETLEACREVEVGAPDGVVRILACPLIGRECVWVHGDEDTFRAIRSEGARRLLSRVEIVREWAERASELGISRGRDVIEEHGERDD